MPKISSIYSLYYRYMKFIFTKTVFFRCFFFPPNQYWFQISIFPLRFLGIQGSNAIPGMLGISGLPGVQGQQGKDGSEGEPCVKGSW